MKYYRCKCGHRTSWSSMGVPECAGCPDCNTTLEEGPDDHRTPAEHDWRTEWAIDKLTGARWQERVCLRCMKREQLPAPPTPEKP